MLLPMHSTTLMPIPIPCCLAVPLSSPIPMLLAFFTYKPASVLQAFKDVLENSEDEEETA